MNLADKRRQSYTQLEFCEKLKRYGIGFSRITLSRIERGIRPVTSHEREVFEDILGDIDIESYALDKGHVIRYIRQRIGKCHLPAVIAELIAIRKLVQRIGD